MNSGYIRNMFVLMRKSQSQNVQLLALHYEGRVQRFLEHVILSPKCVVALTEGTSREADIMCAKIFCYGWLSPKAEFIPIPISKHEETVTQITGHPDCDTACKNGWVKFLVGLPYQDVDSLLEWDANRNGINVIQKKWLNEWLQSITYQPEGKTVF